MHRVFYRYRLRSRLFWTRLARSMSLWRLAAAVMAICAGLLFFPERLLFLKGDLLWLLRVAMPAFAFQEEQEGAGNLLGKSIWRAVPLGDPRGFLSLQNALFSLIKEENGMPGESAPPVSPPVQQPKGCLVAVYHTHTGETYQLSDGVPRLDGKEGGVVRAGEALCRELEQKYGIPTLHIKKIHDRDYGQSYLESEKTVRQVLAEHPEVEVLLDVHRDAGKPREDCVVKVNGKNVATVLIVVGSDARAAFPTWRQNEQFAQLLAAALNKKYPGFCQGVRVKEGRYNQFLHPRALLVEIGSTNNTLEEAVEAARLLADVMGEVVKELVQAGGTPPGTL
ncbi:stage II sporulation protein P [Desulfovirgula thermocuniculi]|uniref:stage II sporulation protein P n=1 Tax=Desulfovirgula thermocuniculi TaxID=348842 RepID=UPI0004145D0C|nr:stage II sporulation protein P [Desulfovirgula thermocuniculi]